MLDTRMDRPELGFGATLIVQEHHESRGNFVMKASHHARCLKGTLMVYKKT